MLLGWKPMERRIDHGQAIQAELLCAADSSAFAAARSTHQGKGPPPVPSSDGRAYAFHKELQERCSVQGPDAFLTCEAFLKRDLPEHTPLGLAEPLLCTEERCSLHRGPGGFLVIRSLKSGLPRGLPKGGKGASLSAVGGAG
mmetsp:Transcript_10348/g.29497  ORF Transcript_10348/g.29497 Transcript_10348/m.29497 type:complete len:142 (-) Transcript_10348:89-514(-)